MAAPDKGVRKFRIALTAMAGVLIGYALAARWPALGALFPVYTGSLLGAAGIFATSNVFEKRVSKPADQADLKPPA